MTSDLRELVAAQDAYFADHSAFSDDLEQLPSLELSPGVTIEVTTHEKGWSATAKHNRLAYRCLVYVGSRGAEHSEMTTGVPECRILPEVDG